MPLFDFEGMYGFFQDNILGQRRKDERYWAELARQRQMPSLEMIRETGSEYEIVNLEERIISNPSRSSTTSRRFTLTQEWTRALEYGHDIKQSVGTNAKIGGDWGSINASLSAEITKKYAVKLGERRVETEEVNVEVRPGGRVKLTLTWRRQWQLGTATYRRSTETFEVPFRTFEVPFRVAKGVYLDQMVTDL